jgi:DNA-binding MarR family transcriptional regulator
VAKHEVLESYISLRREVNLALGERLKSTDFGHKQMLILYYLSLGSITMRELADFTLSDPAAISRAVASLESDGWVVRKASPDDQRKVMVSLTGKGRARSKEAQAVREDIAALVDQTLTAKERDQISFLMKKVVLGLKAQAK